MAAGTDTKAYRSSRASIEYKWFTLDLAAETGREKDVSTPNESQKLDGKNYETKNPEILTKAQLVSAIGAVWDCANRPLPVFQTKGNAEHGKTIGQKENLAHDSVANTEYYNIGIPRKAPLFRSLGSNVNRSCFSKCLQFSHSLLDFESFEVNKMVSVKIPNWFEKIYGWIDKKPYSGLRYGVDQSQPKYHNPDEAGTFRKETSTTYNLAIEDTDYVADLAECEDPPQRKTMELTEKAWESVKSPSSDYFLRPVTDSQEKAAVSRILCSDLSSTYHVHNSDVDNCEQSLDTSDKSKQLDHRGTEHKELFLKDNLKVGTHQSVIDKNSHIHSNKRHAFAGALAGTFVSLCLHPIDTIKTIVQSHGQGQKSVYHVVRSIISERGIAGMYRGIASNITSSAPISAVYTFTYESVKGALLPLMPKEYQSIVHCLAGGCSSIATSFVFTPSERIKQQMQVGTHYRNCWTAFLGILRQGGLPSLYAGWTAVLCRNVPHSIIKFYTYEGLKHFMLSRTESKSSPSTVQTLVCGGLAGSTAALFTTPFDVVKTRLQTQIPGSVGKYDGVFLTLQEIYMHEGLKGLYRGLGPRLIMYVSQGAIFFASYEFFKTVLPLEMQQLFSTAPQKNENMDNNSTSSLPLPSISRAA